MKINRQMLSLFFEIKRSVSIENREQLQLSAPNIGNKLVILHSSTQNARLKDLIERFFELAEDAQWANKIIPLDAEAHAQYEKKKQVCEKLFNISH